VRRELRYENATKLLQKGPKPQHGKLETKADDDDNNNKDDDNNKKDWMKHKGEDCEWYLSSMSKAIRNEYYKKLSR
jgi:hypothetical protein